MGEQDKITFLETGFPSGYIAVHMLHLAVTFSHSVFKKIIRSPGCVCFFCHVKTVHLDVQKTKPNKTKTPR